MKKKRNEKGWRKYETVCILRSYPGGCRSDGLAVSAHLPSGPGSGDFRSRGEPDRRGGVGRGAALSAGQSRAGGDPPVLLWGFWPGTGFPRYFPDDCSGKGLPVFGNPHHSRISSGRGGPGNPFGQYEKRTGNPLCLCFGKRNPCGHGGL